MENISITIIVVLCYMIGEMYKLIFKKEEAYKYIPMVLSISGGIIGVIMYYTNKEIINASNVWSAMLIGIVSGTSSTGANQIIKQIFGGSNGANSKKKDS